MSNAVFKKVIVKVIGMAGVATLSSSLQAASFDCAKASTNIEKMICADKSLSSMDEQLSAIYQKGLESAGDKDSFKKEQRAWLKIRNACADALCVMQSYHARINTFSGTLGAVVEPIVITNSSVSSQIENIPKRVITFTLLEGEGYPLCKEYVEMLNKTQYTEIPVCSRKILPDFKNFKKINWVEMVDKDLIKKILEERAAVLIALNPTVSAQTFSPHNTINRIYEDKSKMFSYEVMLSDDGVTDFVYMTQSYSNFNRKEKHGLCETINTFYFNDSKITIESIERSTRDLYGAFNITGSNEVFVYGDNLYVSIYSGKTYYKVNFEVYGIGNKKMCGILAK